MHGGIESDLGTIFRFDPATRQHTVLATLGGLVSSLSGMVTGANGLLYGTAAHGGTNGCGSILRIIPPRDGQRGRVETMAEFSGIGGTLPGNRPGALTVGTNGALTGVTHTGTAYSITLDGAVRSLGSLRLDGDHPAPNCLLAPHSDGWLYGIPTNGKRFTLFRTHPETGHTEMIPSGGEGWGYTGWCGLVNDGQGGFLTVSGNLGSNGHGGIFRLQPDGRFETVAEFTGTSGHLPGRVPSSELLPVGTDFYGTCENGGSGDRGVIFKLSANSEVSTVAEF